VRKENVVKAGVGGAIALAVSLGVVTPAHADVQPNAKDAVAVGSDTVQYVVDFGADGDVNANPGYNSTNASRRVVSFDATADASGRASYQSNGATLPNSIVIRAGSKPITRPNGSGSGIAALLADSTHQIDFVRSSRLPKPSEQSDTHATAFGGIHVFQIATDGLEIAVASAGTNAPAGLSADELVKIYNGTYKKWSDVPGYTGANGAHGIVPIIPQAGSGTRNDFIADLKTLTGVDLSAAGALAANVKTGEEHDPAAITTVAAGTDVNGNPIAAADAISPFSVGRDNLIDSSYFGTTPAPNTINLLTGTAPDTTAAYKLDRKLYLLARQNDVTSTTPFQLGGSANLVNSLFGKSTSWYAKAANGALFTSAGVVQAWADKGIISG
jgi:ABC-type phosphate transport system substrate-binding protein